MIVKKIVGTGLEGFPKTMGSFVSMGEEFEFSGVSPTGLEPHHYKSKAVRDLSFSLFEGHDDVPTGRVVTDGNNGHGRFSRVTIRHSGGSTEGLAFSRLSPDVPWTVKVAEEELIECSTPLTMLDLPPASPHYESSDDAQPKISLYSVTQVAPTDVPQITFENDPTSPGPVSQEDLEREAKIAEFYREDAVSPQPPKGSHVFSPLLAEEGSEDHIYAQIPEVHDTKIVKALHTLATIRAHLKTNGYNFDSRKDWPACAQKPEKRLSSIYKQLHHLTIQFNPTSSQVEVSLDRSKSSTRTLKINEDGRVERVLKKPTRLLDRSGWRAYKKERDDANALKKYIAHYVHLLLVEASNKDSLIRDFKWNLVFGYSDSHNKPYEET